MLIAVFAHEYFGHGQVTALLKQKKDYMHDGRPSKVMITPIGFGSTSYNPKAYGTFKNVISIFAGPGVNLLFAGLLAIILPHFGMPVTFFSDILDIMTKMYASHGDGKWAQLAVYVAQYFAIEHL